VTKDELAFYFELSKALSGPVSWVLVAIGWHVVSKGNDKRERRKEIRSLIDRVRDTATGLEALANEYYQKAPSDAVHIGWNIKRDLARLAGHLTALEALCKKKPRFDFDGQQLALKQAITGGDFESSARTARLPADPLFPKISLRLLSCGVSELDRDASGVPSRQVAE
jgi:hypothetical protein